MKIRFATTGVLLGMVMAMPSAHAQKLSADGAMQTFNYLADQFFSEVYFKFSPTAGTAAGLHPYDAKLEDYSAAGGAAGGGGPAGVWKKGGADEPGGPEG